MTEHEHADAAPHGGGVTEAADATVPLVALDRAPTTVWVGSAGLRAGWSLCLFVLIAMVVSVPVGVLLVVGFIAGRIAVPNARLEMPTPGQPASWPLFLIGEVAGIAVILAATFAMSFIERRRFGEFGLGGSNRWKQLGAGAFWGLFCFSLLIVVLWMTKSIAFDRVMLTGWPILSYGLCWLLAFGSVEFLRGDTLPRLHSVHTRARYRPPWLGVLDIGPADHLRIRPGAQE